MDRVILLLLLMICLAATCERPANIVIEEPEPRLVVISNFTNGTAVQVQVSRSSSIFDPTNINYILDAKVQIFQEDNFIEDLVLVTPPENLAPFYTTRNFLPQENVLYTIEVEANGFAPVSATSIIPSQVNITALQISDLEMMEQTETGITDYNFTVSMSFQDPIGVDNYYQLDFFQQIYNFQIMEGDTLLLENYLERIRFTPLNDNNNLIAYFEGGLLFQDDNFEGEIASYSFPLTVSINSLSELPGKMFVELRSVSKEYYLYYNSLSRQQTSAGPPFSDPVILFNNIENGNGVFAGYNFALDSIRIR